MPRKFLKMNLNNKNQVAKSICIIFPLALLAKVMPQSGYLQALRHCVLGG